MKRVLKWTVPVDNQYHPIGFGKVVHVDVQYGPDAVQVWTEEIVSTIPVEEARAVRVFGTGQRMDDDLEHVGSVTAADGRLIWHVYATPKVRK